MDSSYLSQTKIFSHLERVEEWLKTGSCFPITVEVDPTNKCTRNCPQCAGNRYRKNDYLPLSFMKDLIRQIAPFCKGLIFTGGGEPLCNNATIPAIEYAKKFGIEVALVTNGDLLEREAARSIVQNCTYVRMSYNDEKNWSKLRLLAEARKTKRSNCSIGIGMLTSKTRVSLMKRFAQKAKEVGADYAQFRPYHLDTFDAMSTIRKLQKQLNRKYFRVIASEYKYVDMKERLKKTGEYKISFADNFRTVISAEGKMYPDCWTRGMKSFCLGNLYKQNFKEIWKSKRRKNILVSKLQKKNCPPMCFHDPLNELLWQIWMQNKQEKHLNFV